MSSNRQLFTSESVSHGHPDKLCDQISDCLLDNYLKIDPNARVAIETMATTNQIIVAGETRITNNKEISKDQIQEIIRNKVKEISYDQQGFSYKTVKITNLIHSQSPEIASIVDENNQKEEGAGDQGIMFGYACRETKELMPAPIYYANNILINIFNAVKNKQIANLGPDAKSQITLIYENNKVVGVDNILVSIQHPKSINYQDLKQILLPIIKKTLPTNWPINEDKILVNPKGSFIIGGPDGDTGLTGRKIIIDTYGGAAPHGGGAFSGKDPTKVDRSAAYMARYLAKNIVASKILDKCTIQLSYAIGVAKPLSIFIDDHGQNIDKSKLITIINQLCDLTPKGIKQKLNLNQPIYSQTAAYGHFGRKVQKNGCFSWEKTDLADKINQLYYAK